MISRPLAGVVVAVGMGLASSAASDETPRDTPASTSIDDDTISAAEADEKPQATRSKWNEYDSDLIRIHAGFGLIVDYAVYDQDAASAQQMPMLKDEWGLRDFRLMANGDLKFIPRTSFSIGYMYDPGDELWRWRQTGIMIDVKELNGSLFIGRGKEGSSMTRIMVGYDIWTMERAAVNDAFFPILADGAKWTGTGFSNQLVYNLGLFTDVLNEKQPFSRNDWQTVGRAVWLPFATTGSPTQLHLGVQGRYGAADDGILKYSSKPETFIADSNAVDSGELQASGATTAGVEAFLRSGPLIVGGEYYWTKIAADAHGDPFFHGGEASAVLLLGAQRPYNRRGGYFQAVSVCENVQGGPGAFEIFLRYSYLDEATRLVDGGRFWRISPGLIWHISNYLRLSSGYGYGNLDRGGMSGNTHFLTTRVHITF